jgi:ankyrin repeat protein
LLLRHSGDVNCTGRQGETALLFAVKTGKVRMAEHLLNERAGIDTVDKLG